MKLALLSGADKNAGDFLIVHRSRQLLLELVENCELVDFPRNRRLDPYLDEINSCDAVVLAGGPGYVPDMYPGRFPLVDDLSRIKPPFFALGMGGYTPTPSIEGIKFAAGSRMLLDRIESDGFSLGCRDILTTRLLQENGYDSALFTGCPAWYDLSKVDLINLKKSPSRREVKSIAVSDPASLHNIFAPKYLIEELKRAFPSADIKLVFHRGWTHDKFSSSDLAKGQEFLVQWAETAGVRSVDISYSHEGFAEYDECDLHIGYRVHAHLYNVSQRKPSFLIEEDGRGYGANDALGIKTHISLGRPGLPARAINKALRKIGARRTLIGKGARETAAEMVAHVLSEIDKGYPEEELACKTAHGTFRCMRSHISQLNHLDSFRWGEERKD